jgi:hypothetical protein
MIHDKSRFSLLVNDASIFHICKKKNHKSFNLILITFNNLLYFFLTNENGIYIYNERQANPSAQGVLRGAPKVYKKVHKSNKK